MKKHRVDQNSTIRGDTPLVCKEVKYYEGQQFGNYKESDIAGTVLAGQAKIVNNGTGIAYCPITCRIGYFRAVCTVFCPVIRVSLQPLTLYRGQSAYNIDNTLYRLFQNILNASRLFI